MQYKLGFCKRVILAAGVLPTKFDCRENGEQLGLAKTSRVANAIQRQMHRRKRLANTSLIRSGESQKIQPVKQLTVTSKSK